MTRYRTFSLVTLCLLLAAASFVLGMYRLGYDTARQQQRQRMVTTVSYEVSDLVSSGERDEPEIRAQLEELERLIHATVQPESWQASSAGGGTATIFYDNRTLVITHHGSAHQEIRELLEQLREELPAGE